MTAQRIITAALVALAGALVVAGCSDEDDSIPQEPQIVPHVNPVNFCQIEMPAPNTPCEIGNPEMECPVGSCGCDGATCTCIPRQVTFDLMLFNRGRERLDITGYDVMSDRRCAFEPPGGNIQLYDNEDTDEFAATVRSREAAFMRIRYSPPAVGADEVTVKIHSNAQNFPEPEGLDIYVCAEGTENTTLNCRVRLDPECNDSTANAFSCTPGPESQASTPCPSYCTNSGDECTPPSLEDPVGVPCPEGDFCRSPYYCVEDENDPFQGTCYCRPCAVPPDEGWDDCPQG